MKVIMKTLLANHLGVFRAGDEYEASDESCKALVAEGYAYYPGFQQVMPESAAKEQPEKAVKKRAKPRKKSR